MRYVVIDMSHRYIFVYVYVYVMTRPLRRSHTYVDLGWTCIIQYVEGSAGKNLLAELGRG